MFFSPVYVHSGGGGSSNKKNGILRVRAPKIGHLIVLCVRQKRFLRPIKYSTTACSAGIRRDETSRRGGTRMHVAACVVCLCTCLPVRMSVLSRTVCARARTECFR